MRMLFKCCEFKRIKDGSVYMKKLIEIMDTIGFGKEKRMLKNTCNLFSNERPTREWWIATQIGELDWTVHVDCYSTKTDDLFTFWNCYQPHLLIGDAERIENILSIAPKSLLTSLTHIVSDKKVEHPKAWEVSFVD